MIAAALALSLAFAAPQTDVVTHDQAVTCTGVFLFAGIVMAQTAEADPSPENTETVEAAGRLLKAADADRLAAATREGLSSDRSGEILQAWVQANLDDAQGVMNRDLDPCLTRYASAI